MNDIYDWEEFEPTVNDYLAKGWELLSMEYYTHGYIRSTREESTTRTARLAKGNQIVVVTAARE